MVCFILCDKYFCCFAMPKKKLPVKHLNCDIRAPWHVPREYECIGAHTMRYCTVQLCLHRTNRSMGSCEKYELKVLIPVLEVYHAHLIFQPFCHTLVILIEVGKAKGCLICPINSSVHAVIVMRAMAAAVHIHSSLQTNLYNGKWSVLLVGCTYLM